MTVYLNHSTIEGHLSSFKFGAVTRKTAMNIYVCVCVCVPFQIPFHYMLFKNIEYSSLQYVVDPCCLSTLYIAVLLIYSLSLSPLVTMFVCYVYEYISVL